MDPPPPEEPAIASSSLATPQRPQTPQQQQQSGSIVATPSLRRCRSSPLCSPMRAQQNDRRASFHGGGLASNNDSAIALNACLVCQELRDRVRELEESYHRTPCAFFIPLADLSISAY